MDLELQVVLIVDDLHELVHFCALGVRMLPELSGHGEGIHPVCESCGDIQEIV